MAQRDTQLPALVYDGDEVRFNDGEDTRFVGKHARHITTQERVFVNYARGRLQFLDGYTISEEVFDKMDDSVTTIYVVDMANNEVLKYAKADFLQRGEYLPGNDPRINAHSIPQFLAKPVSAPRRWSLDYQGGERLVEKHTNVNIHFG